MINRRSFLIALTAQPVLYSGLSKLASTYMAQPKHAELDSSEFIILDGWTLLKTDVLEPES
jgi:hypothetical protein